ncbi:MAG: LuxR C-terminal-related transcriptional regulator [Rhodocyclaceae bacterium]|nr:LuxR C-terminal-related transcriptional regulator [Rhodocyclaceae bacterium]
MHLATAAEIQPGMAAEPPLFSFPIVRTAVFEELTQAGARPPEKLTVVTAPTGYGKTVLLTALHDHYRENGGDVLWLALDDRDIGAGRVLAHLEKLFGLHEERIAPIQAMHQGDEPLDERMGRLLERIAAVEQPTTLFIDNLDYCTDPVLARLIDGLIFRTPRPVFLVLSSARIQTFSAARAKLEGLLRNVGLADLSLDGAATLELLGPALHTRLSNASVEAIVRQTEGWPSAVRLMKIILSTAASPDDAVASFTGADEDLAALLNRQILGGLETGFRQFLLQISQLRSFNADLAREATGDPLAAGYIERLWQNSIFLIPLDRNRSNYRLHTLFREFLNREAQNELAPEKRLQVLNRAALWCEKAGCRDEAIDYALAARALPQAISMLERIAPVVVRDHGDLRRYIDWVEKLHAQGERGGWETDYWYVWALVFHRRYEKARGQVARLVERWQDETAGNPEDAGLRALGRRIDIIRITIGVHTDRLEEAQLNAQRWLCEANGANGASGADDPFDVTIASCAASFHAVASCKLVEARSMIRLAQSSVEQSQNHHAMGWVAVAVALAAMREGEYRTAYRELVAALEKARAALGDRAGICSPLALLAAKCAVEMGMAEEAAELLAFGLRRIKSYGIIDAAALGFDAALKLWNGQDGAAISVGALKEIAKAYPPRLSLMLSCFLIRRLIRLGRVEEAKLEAEHIGLRQGDAEPGVEMAASGGLRDLVAATQTDLQIALGRLKQAGDRVADEIQRARSDGRAARLVELALDEAAIGLCSRNATPATRHLGRAISLAARRQYLRPFLDRPELVAALVNQTRLKDWRFTLDEEQRFFARICQDLPTGNAVLADQMQEIGSARSLSETPTEKELGLLSLIEAGLSNKQIADHLSMTVPTIKWHLYNLYIKLGVNSRAAALARARSLNLLSR